MRLGRTDVLQDILLLDGHTAKNVTVTVLSLIIVNREALEILLDILPLGSTVPITGVIMSLAVKWVFVPSPEGLFRVSLPGCRRDGDMLGSVRR